MSVVRSGWTSFTNPGDAVRAVTATAGFKKRFGKLAVHPYNEHDPERSVWWLFRPAKSTPNEVWPAYHAGKFIFHIPKGGHALRFGLHVEKGIGADLASVYGAPRMKLDSKWSWHSFVQDLAHGKVERSLNEIAARSGEVPLIEIEVGAPLDKPELREAGSTYQFTATNTGSLVLKEFKRSKQVIDELEAAVSFQDLGTRLGTLAPRAMQMLWINIEVGVSLPIRSAEDPGEWAGAEIWSNVLDPLSPWIT